LAIYQIPLFHPAVSGSAIQAVTEVLQDRWIGQGPRVDRFETAFRDYLGGVHTPVAVGAGTDALHLSYILADIGPGCEVITPVFGCAATTMPLLYQGATIRFADIRPDTLNIDPAHVRELVNDRTRAIVCVHYGGLPCDLDELRACADAWGIPVIEDAAQAIGGVYRSALIGTISPFTAFSFQAVKHFTTGDGGMLVIRDPALAAMARRLRWFGIDRQAKLADHWDGQITDVGYKYQMTDIAAAMGIEGLKALDGILHHRRVLFREYCRRLQNVAGIEVIGGCHDDDRTHAAWLLTVRVEDAEDLRRKLSEHGIESSAVHYRLDGYAVFSAFRGSCPQMDGIEGRYLALPLHTCLSIADVEHICDVVAS
jgi:dTDP-4-amino-4,6-dideoxygalactose transaminase